MRKHIESVVWGFYIVNFAAYLSARNVYFIFVSVEKYHCVLVMISNQSRYAHLLRNSIVHKTAIIGTRLSRARLQIPSLYALPLRYYVYCLAIKGRSKYRDRSGQ